MLGVGQVSGSAPALAACSTQLCRWFSAVQAFDVRGRVASCGLTAMVLGVEQPCQYMCASSIVTRAAMAWWSSRPVASTRHHKTFSH